KFYSWWQEQGISWEQKIRYQMMKYRSISYDLELDNQQIKIWRSYFNANKLIIDYLEKNASVSQELQQQIEEQLFLAIADNNP
ncbi:MAG: NACHT C-terminal helical domain 2-containing protein, partial [Trichormus sp.]